MAVGRLPYRSIAVNSFLYITETIALNNEKTELKSSLLDKKNKNELRYKLIKIENKSVATCKDIKYGKSAYNNFNPAPDVSIPVSSYHKSKDIFTPTLDKILGANIEISTLEPRNKIVS